MAFPKQSKVALPILQALVDLGGQAKPKQIYPRVASFFPALTTEEQEQRMESSPSVRKWWNLVQWERQKAVDRGEIDRSVISASHFLSGSASSIAS
jgi:restriction system protein